MIREKMKVLKYIVNYDITIILEAKVVDNQENAAYNKDEVTKPTKIVLIEVMKPTKIMLIEVTKPIKIVLMATSVSM